MIEDFPTKPNRDSSSQMANDPPSRLAYLDNQELCRDLVNAPDVVPALKTEVSFATKSSLYKASDLFTAAHYQFWNIGGIENFLFIASPVYDKDSC